MSTRRGKGTGHNTIWRCDEQVCRMVADVYDRDAAQSYRDLLNVIASNEVQKIRFEVVTDAGFWKGSTPAARDAST